MFLPRTILDKYKDRPIDWGFKSGPNSLGELTYRRTYSRRVVVPLVPLVDYLNPLVTHQPGTRLFGKIPKRFGEVPTGSSQIFDTKTGDPIARLSSETWPETVYRVVDGTFEILQGHCEHQGLPFDQDLALAEAAEMYERIWSFKFTPPGRGLWMMGTDFIRINGGAALNNCGFVSTENLDKDFSKPFRFLMDMSMLGVGVGFDTKGAGKLSWRPDDSLGDYTHVVGDSRLGWVELIGALIDWGFGKGPQPVPDVSQVRVYGAPIHGFGGTASGPEPLLNLYRQIFNLIQRRRGLKVSSRDIVDVQNMIGACVVAGNVRRTAEIAFGDPEDEEYLDLKDYAKNPDRAEWGWTSNNSIFAEVGMDYGPAAQRTMKNGEPGYFWLENAQRYGRMKDPPNNKDYRARGGNPCLEQTLESYELCCLVENFISKQKDLPEFKKTLKYSYLYAKTVTLAKTHWRETNAVMLRNRRIGSSVSGVVNFLHQNSERKLIKWLDDGYQTICHYDRVYSDWLAIRESIKKTGVKPSGTVSLPAGVRPGGHYGTDDYHLRRIRFAKDHPDVQAFLDAGYHVEPDVRDPYTVVVEFPVEGDGTPTEREVSLGKKVHLASILQKYWADNQVSYTATFLPEEGKLIPDLLRAYEDKLKGISFLPILDQGAYPQMPYESLTREDYEARAKKVQRIRWSDADAHDQEERSCDGGACAVEVKK